MMIADACARFFRVPGTGDNGMHLVSLERVRDCELALPAALALAIRVMGIMDGSKAAYRWRQHHTDDLTQEAM
jgi:hypothetical protein